MACNSTGFPSWGGGGSFANCFCPGGTGIFRQQCQNNSGGSGGFFCPPCPWPGGGWPGGGWPGGGGGGFFCPPWGGGGGGGWWGGGWPGGGGFFCPPCPPQNNNCCCDCSCCGGGAGACGPDNPSCNRCPWLDAASVFGGMYRSEVQQRELAAGTTGEPVYQINIPAESLDAPLVLLFSLPTPCHGTTPLLHRSKAD